MPAALVTGLTWIIGVLLVATQAPNEPIGLLYDDANRFLVIPLALAVITALAVRNQLVRSGRAGAGAALAVVAGLALTLAGSALEFWGALVAGTDVSAIAARLGTTEFWGSWPGFLLFLAGGPITVISLIVLGVRSRTWPGASALTAVAIGVSGVLFSVSTFAWGISPAAAAIPATLFAFCWVSLARAATRLA
jgi:hypothetical protein